MPSFPPRTDGTRTTVLAYIGAHGATSRAELARRLDVSAALVTQVVRDLLEDGLLIESAVPDVARRGRPAKLLNLVSATASAVGVKVAPDHVAFVEVGLDGAVLRSDAEPFDAISPLASVDLVGRVEAFVSGGDPNAVVGIGVGVPGTVSDRGIGVVNSTQLGWHQVPLGAALRNALDIPVVVENNVNALTIAEKLFGRGRTCDDFLVITIGNGVGAGVCSGGVVLRGAAGGIGDFGHIQVAAGGPLCQCGNRGCLEALIGQQALVHTAEDAGVLKPGSRIADLLHAADQHDRAAAGVYADAAELLGRTLAGAVNMLDPELVILMGEGVSAWRFWEDTFERALRPALVPGKRGVTIAVEDWEDDRWAQGAAALVLATPFDHRGVAGKQGQLMRERLVLTSGGVRP